MNPTFMEYWNHIGWFIALATWVSFFLGLSVGAWIADKYPKRISNEP